VAHPHRAPRSHELEPEKRWQPVMCKAASKAIAHGAKTRAADLAPTIAELQAAGVTSLRAIAAGLNERGIPTARRTGIWSATQVMRVMARC
jgi:hypothetical protein